MQHNGDEKSLDSDQRYRAPVTVSKAGQLKVNTKRSVSADLKGGMGGGCNYQPIRLTLFLQSNADACSAVVMYWGAEEPRATARRNEINPFLFFVLTLFC